MLSARLALREEDVVRLSLEFLHNRELHISQLSIERETGVINGQYSDDILFLRQLILDGQWDDVIEVRYFFFLFLFSFDEIFFSVHTATGGAASVRHEKISLLDFETQIHRIVVYKIGSWWCNDRRWPGLKFR